MNSSAGSRVIAVQVAGRLVGISLERVVEVATLGHVTRVEPASAAVHGIANLRGTVITLLDLCQILEGRPAQTSRTAINVIVNDGHESIGLVADQLVGVYDVDKYANQEGPRHFAEGRAGLVSSILQLERDLLMVLDLDGVLERARAN